MSLDTPLGALNLELLHLREKLRRDESLTLPEQRWLAWTCVEAVRTAEKDRT